MEREDGIGGEGGWDRWERKDGISGRGKDIWKMEDMISARGMMGQVGEG